VLFYEHVKNVISKLHFLDATVLESTPGNLQRMPNRHYVESPTRPLFAERVALFTSKYQNGSLRVDETKLLVNKFFNYLQTQKMESAFGIINRTHEIQPSEVSKQDVIASKRMLDANLKEYQEYINDRTIRPYGGVNRFHNCIQDAYSDKVMELKPFREGPSHREQLRGHAIDQSYQTTYVTTKSSPKEYLFTPVRLFSGTKYYLTFDSGFRYPHLSDKSFLRLQQVCTKTKYKDNRIFPPNPLRPTSYQQARKSGTLAKKPRKVEYFSNDVIESEYQEFKNIYYADTIHYTNDFQHV